VVWDDVFYEEVKLTKMETELTLTPEFNRIKGITQLGLVYLAPQFPSAQHTRYNHSIGVLHLANKAGIHFSLNEEQITALRIAALLHDIGHGPFSHFSEKILGWLGVNVKHEDVSARIIKKSSNIGKIWRKYANLPNRDLIADIISKKPSDYPILNKILSNDIDIDRIDYLLRDLKFTGLGYSLNCDRLIHGLTPIVCNTDTAIKEDYTTDVNSLLLSRVLLRQHVYYEPIHRAAEVLIFDSLQKTMKEKGNSTFNNLKPNELERKLFEMNDGAFLFELGNASKENQQLIKEIKQGKVYDFHLTLKWRQLSPYLQDEIINNESKPFKENFKLSNKIRQGLSGYLRINQDEIFVDIPKLERLEEASMKVFTVDNKIMRLEDFSALARSLKDVYREVWSMLVFIRSKRKEKINFKNIEENIRSFFSSWRE
jgi:hypothetical protein